MVTQHILDQGWAAQVLEGHWPAFYPFSLPRLLLITWITCFQPIRGCNTTIVCKRTGRCGAAHSWMDHKHPFLPQRSAEGWRFDVLQRNSQKQKTCLTFELQISRLSGTWTCSFCRCSCSQSDRPSQSSKNWWSVEESLDVWRRDIHLQNFWLVKWSEHCFWENPKLQNLSRALIGASERVHTKHSSSRTAVWCLWVMQEHLQWSWDHTV